MLHASHVLPVRLNEVNCQHAESIVMIVNELKLKFQLTIDGKGMHTFDHTKSVAFSFNWLEAFSITKCCCMLMSSACHVPGN